MFAKPMKTSLQGFLALGVSLITLSWGVEAQDYSGDEMVDALEKKNGKFEGFRRVHAKGICGAGHFISNGAGESLSEAQVFEKDRSTPVVFRFSNAGGNPFNSDKQEPVRSMALIFEQENGEQWRTAMIHPPMFLVGTPEAFMKAQVALMADPATGKPDPKKLRAFVMQNPDSMGLLRYMQSNLPPKGFKDAPYNSIHTFHFVTGDTATPVRWRFTPTDGVVLSDPSELAGKSDNYLFEELQAAVADGTASWTLTIQKAAEGDDVTNAAKPWPEDRERLTLGTLTLSSVDNSADAACRMENFDPIFLPTGIEPSDDPLIYARSAAYAASYGRRYDEKDRGVIASKPD